MNPADAWLTLVTVSVCLLLGVGALGVARATEPTRPAASASVERASSPAAVPPETPMASSSHARTSDQSSTAEKGGWLPPETSSKKPEAAEWDGARPLALPRKHCNGWSSDGVCSSACSAKVLREWVELRCTRAKGTEVFMGVRVLAGPADDVTLVDPPEPKGGDKGQRGFSLVFPVRRGDRRTIEVAEMLPLAWKAWTVEESLAMVVSAMWLPNAARPVVTAY